MPQGGRKARKGGRPLGTFCSWARPAPPPPADVELREGPRVSRSSRRRAASAHPPPPSRSPPASSPLLVVAHPVPLPAPSCLRRPRSRHRRSRGAAAAQDGAQGGGAEAAGAVTGGSTRRGGAADPGRGRGAGDAGQGPGACRARDRQAGPARLCTPGLRPCGMSDPASGRARPLHLNATDSDHFQPRRHRLSAPEYRATRTRAFAIWRLETCGQVVA